MFWDPFWKMFRVKMDSYLAVWMCTSVLILAVQASSSLSELVTLTDRRPISLTTASSTSSLEYLSVRGPVRDLQPVSPGPWVSIRLAGAQTQPCGGGLYGEGEQSRGRTPGSLKSCGGPVCLFWPTWKPSFGMTVGGGREEIPLRYDSSEREMIVVWY